MVFERNGARLNNEDKRKVKVGIAVSAFAIIFYLALNNLEKVKGFFGYFTDILAAFIVGLCFAFVLNLFMSMFENKVVLKVDPKKHPKIIKFKRPISLLVTLVLFIGIIAALISFIVPQLKESVSALINNTSSYMESMQNFTDEQLSKFGVSADLNETIKKLLTDLSNYIFKVISTSAPKIFAITKDITSGIFNTFIGFIVGIYMLAGKEGLLRNIKKMLYAFVPKKESDYTVHVYRIVKDRFTSFVTGQLTEAFIIGVLCFIGMTVLNMKYALLISVIIGLTNMVPIVGPIIGAVPGTLIMLMVDPSKALWFIIFIVILQQLESNLIYPRVVGSSIGLPGIWVIFAISIGGALFGLVGVLVGVPIFAVIYTLISEITEKQLKKKGLDVK